MYSSPPIAVLQHLNCWSNRAQLCQEMNLAPELAKCYKRAALGGKIPGNPELGYCSYVHCRERQLLDVPSVTLAWMWSWGVPVPLQVSACEMFESLWCAVYLIFSFSVWHCREHKWIGLSAVVAALTGSVTGILTQVRKRWLLNTSFPLQQHLCLRWDVRSSVFLLTFIIFFSSLMKLAILGKTEWVKVFMPRYDLFLLRKPK